MPSARPARLSRGMLSLCLTLLLFACANPVFAQGAAKLRGEGGVVRLQTSSGRTLPLYSDYAALVIGVGDYKHWPQLQGPTRDVEEVARILRGLGFAVKTLKDPDSRQLEDALYDLPYGLGAKEDRGLLIYYSGHGATERLADGTKLGYLVAKDCPLSSDRRRFGRCAVSMSDVEVIALKIKSRHVLMVFDSCFSGSLFNMFKAEPSAYLEEKIAQPVRYFITAGTEDEKVPDRSTFKTVFVQGLGRGYADVNRDGFVTGTELGKYLAENVVNYTRKRQHPQYGKINKAELDKGDFVFMLAGGPGVIGGGGTDPRKGNIERLLNEADELFRRNKLTTPPGANAMERYNQVLSLDPLNSRADTGLKKIVGRYVEWAEASMETGDYGKAEQYLSGAEKAIERDERTVRMWVQIQQAKQDSSAEEERKRAELANKKAAEESARQTRLEAERQVKTEAERIHQQSSQAVERSRDGRYSKDSDGVITDSKTGLQWYVGPDPRHQLERNQELGG